MSRQIRFYQISHQTQAIAFRNNPPALQYPLINLLQKHGAQWNISLNHLEIPIKNTAQCKKEIKAVDDKVVIQDSFPSLFRQFCMVTSQKQVLHIESKAKWRRYILFDGFMMKKREYIMTFLSKPIKKKQGPAKQIGFRRILLLCCECMVINWIEQVLQKSKTCYKLFDYKSLMSNDHYKISSDIIRQNEIQILTYQRLEQVGNLLNKSILSKYSTIICDDCQVWINQQHNFYNSNQLKNIAKKILLLTEDKELIMILSTLPLQRIDELFFMCNLVKPRHFGEDLLKIERKDINNARWIKQRYSKESKCYKELLYLLENTLLKSITFPEISQLISTSNHGIVFQNMLHITLDSNALQKIQSLDKKYKKVNKKEVLSNFQGERSKGNFVFGEKSKMEEKKFLQQLRQVILNEKLMAVNRYLYYMIKQLNLRVILIIQSSWLFEKVQKFLIEQQITFLLYEIKIQDILAQQKGYKAFNCGQIKLCILVREKLYKQYQRCFNARNKQLQMQFQQEAQAQLGIQRGGLYQLALHKQELHDALFKKQKLMDVPKINSSRHIISLDTYWYNFDHLKEKIIRKILNHQHIYAQQPLSPLQYQAFRPILAQKQHSMTKHVFIAKNLCEKTFLFKYNLNYMAFQQQLEQQQVQEQEKHLSLENFTKNMIEKHSKKYQHIQTIKQVYDIDDEFSQLQRKIKEQKLNEKEPQEIKYNNHIEGLIPETPNLFHLPHKDKHIPTEPQTYQLIQKEIDLNNVSWLSQKTKSVVYQEEEETSQQSQGTINIAKYLLFNKQSDQENNQRPWQKEQQSLPKQAKLQENSSDSSDSLASSIHLQCEKRQVDQQLIVPLRMNKNYVESQSESQQKKGQQKKSWNNWNKPSKILGNTHKNSFPIEVIDVEELDDVIVTKKSRGLSGFRLWSNKIGEQKIIGRKYKTLKVVLKPNASRLKSDPKKPC